jgi:hypothetical protein
MRVGTGRTVASSTQARVFAIGQPAQPPIKSTFSFRKMEADVLELYFMDGKGPWAGAVSASRRCRAVARQGEAPRTARGPTG